MHLSFQTRTRILKKLQANPTTHPIKLPYCRHMFGILFLSTVTHICLATSLHLPLQVISGVLMWSWATMGLLFRVHLRIMIRVLSFGIFRVKIWLLLLIPVCCMKRVYAAWKWHLILGTSLLALSPEPLQAYLDATGAVLDDNGLYFVTYQQFLQMQDLTVTVSGVSI